MKHPFRRVLAVAVGVTATAALAAGPANARVDRAEQGAWAIRVTATDFRFQLRPAYVRRAGQRVTFTLVNRGGSPHDFRVAGKKTAVIGPGRTARLVVRFTKAGRYPYVCTVRGHAAAGMRGRLTVRPAQ
jgi:nitrite reductase (NO-forming)